MVGRMIVLFLLISHVLSDSCVTYTFEKDFDILFTNNTGICTNLLVWDVGLFQDTDLTDHNERSTKFIFPQQTLSCINSFTFAIAPGGIIETNIYMESAQSTDHIQVVAMEPVPNGSDVFVGQAVNTPGHAATFVSGWHTLRITVIGNNRDMIGYISIMGMASSSSTVLVDSFRYIPPGMDAHECEIYTIESTEESNTETTIGTTTESATESTTDSTSESTTVTTNIPTTQMSSEATSTSSVAVTTEVTTESVHITEPSTTLPITDDSDDSFWTPLLIKILVIASVAILITSLLCTFCFCCCKKSQVSVIVVKA